MKLIICPVHNEEKTLEIFYNKLREHYRSDVLFVDDGSADGSKVFLGRITDKNTFLVQSPKRQGYGAALISGFGFALKNKYRKILTMDVDLQHNPRHISSFLQELENYDVVLGSRYTKKKSLQEYDNVPADRLLINRYIVKILNALFSVEFTDPFCGFRGYRDSFLKETKLGERSYGFSLEILLEIIRTQTRFKEIAIEAIYLDWTRKFLEGLDDPRVRFFYYLDVILGKYQEIKNEEKDFSRKPTS